MSLTKADVTGTGLAAADVHALPNTAVAAKQAATGEASFVGVDGTGSDAASLADLQAVASKLDALNAALVAAGLESAS